MFSQGAAHTICRTEQELTSIVKTIRLPMIAVENNYDDNPTASYPGHRSRRLAILKAVVSASLLKAVNAICGLQSFHPEVPSLT